MPPRIIGILYCVLQPLEPMFSPLLAMLLTLIFQLVAFLPSRKLRCPHRILGRALGSLKLFWVFEENAS